MVDPKKGAYNPDLKFQCLPVALPHNCILAICSIRLSCGRTLSCVCRKPAFTSVFQKNLPHNPFFFITEKIIKLGAVLGLAPFTTVTTYNQKCRLSHKSRTATLEFCLLFQRPFLFYSNKQQLLSFVVRFILATKLIKSE